MPIQLGGGALGSMEVLMQYLNELMKNVNFSEWLQTFEQ